MFNNWDVKYEKLNLQEKVKVFNELICKYREPGFQYVKPEIVVPDTTNRESTGISIMHMHYIALQMQNNGFKPRNDFTGEGHDIPFLVREKTDTGSLIGIESLNKWQTAQNSDHQYPPQQSWMSMKDQEFFCSLGNGHFFQALNLFGTKHVCKFSKKQEKYSMESDLLLQQAVQKGVRSVILQQSIPEVERKFISQMLNSTFEFKWIVTDESVYLDSSQEFRSFSSFDGLSKHADTFELDEIILTRLKLDKNKTKPKL